MVAIMERFPRFLCLSSYDPLFLLSPEITRNSTAFFATRTAANHIPPTLAYGSPSTFSAISSSSLLPSVDMFEGTIVIDLVTVTILALLAMVLLAFWIYHVQSRKNKVYIVIVVKFKTFRIKFKKVQKSSRKNEVHKSS